MALTTLKVVVFVLALPLFLIDLLIYILSFSWINNKKKNKQQLQSIAVGEATTTHGLPRRSPKSAGALYKSNITMHQAIMQAVEQYGNNNNNNKKATATIAMVTRKFIELRKIKETDKFPTKVYDNDQVEEISYQQLGQLIRNFGYGLRLLEKKPSSSRTSTSTIVIYEETCKQWSITMHGALSQQNMIVATCYATLGDDAVVAAVNETKASMLLLNWKNVNKFLTLVDKKLMPTLHTIIASTHEMPNGTIIPNSGSNNGKGVQVISWDDVIELGQTQQHDMQSVSPPPQVHDTAVIMYTSGSTGKPKGVVMTHEQLMSGVQGMAQNVYLRPGQEVHISYLPLAHVLALQIENAIFSSGGKVCYADARGLAKALTLFHPTVFAGVPKVFEILRDALLKKIDSSSSLAGHLFKNFFEILFAWKSLLLSYGIDSPFLVTNLFFRQISNKVFGGILALAVSGGGSLNASLHNFCRVVFCCPVIQGFALTETCVGGAFQDTRDLRDNVVGPPVPCVEIMLQSEPEIKDNAGMPYLHTDTVSAKGEPVIGRGEICMRGPCISTGYYQMPDKTKEVFDEDGWFHSGDIGQFTHDGVLQIIDRKKNIVKLKGGEYVAVENMENAYSQSPLVSFACVVANSELDRALVIANTNNTQLEKWAVENGVSYTSLQDLALKKETKQAVIASMKQHGKEAGLTSLENGIVDCALITDTAWEAGHGFTASGKIDRAAIFRMHADKLNAMLQRNGAPPL